MGPPPQPMRRVSFPGKLLACDVGLRLISPCEHNYEISIILSKGEKEKKRLHGEIYCWSCVAHAWNPGWKLVNALFQCRIGDANNLLNTSSDSSSR